MTITLFKQETELMISNDKLIGFKEKINEWNLNSSDKAIKMFYLEINDTIELILNQTPLVYNKVTFDELHKIISDAVLPCLDEWNEKKESSFHKFLENFALFNNDGVSFLRKTIMNGKIATEEFKNNISPINKDNYSYKTNKEEQGLDEWKSDVFKRFKSLQKTKTGIEDCLGVSILFGVARLWELQKMVHAQEDAIYFFIKGIKPIVGRIISTSVLKRGISPKDENERQMWIDAASAHTIEILNKWDPEKGSMFKTYLVRSSGQILDLICDMIWTKKRKTQKNEEIFPDTRSYFLRKPLVSVIATEDAANIKKRDLWDDSLSIETKHGNDDEGWTAGDIIADPKYSTPDKEIELREVNEELEKTESIDKGLIIELAEQINNRFACLDTNLQIIILDCYINNISDSKVGEKLGKYRKTVTNWKKKGLKILRDEILVFFNQDRLRDLLPERQQRIIVTALGQFIELDG